MCNQEALYRTWGAYLNYPQCCINDFVERVLVKQEGVPSYINSSPFKYSGFIPCRSCHSETKDMDLEGITEWLGHNPFDEGEECHTSFVLKRASSDRFKMCAYGFNLDYEDYIEFLKGQIKRKTTL